MKKVIFNVFGKPGISAWLNDDYHAPNHSTDDKYYASLSINLIESFLNVKV